VVSGQHSNWLFYEWKGETERWPHISEEEGSKRAIWWHVRQAAERFRWGADGGGGVGFQKRTRPRLKLPPPLSALG
jgi:hypothetical protein